MVTSATTAWLVDATPVATDITATLSGFTLNWPLACCVSNLTLFVSGANAGAVTIVSGIVTDITALLASYTIDWPVICCSSTTDIFVAGATAGVATINGGASPVDETISNFATATWPICCCSSSNNIFVSGAVLGDAWNINAGVMTNVGATLVGFGLVWPLLCSDLTNAIVIYDVSLAAANNVVVLDSASVFTDFIAGKSGVPAFGLISNAPTTMTVTDSVATVWNIDANGVITP